MAYPNTGSTLKSGLSTGLSTQIIITAEIKGDGKFEPVGAVRELTETQNRTLARVHEIGTDGTIEIVPQKAAEYDLSLTRIVFDGLSIAEAFGRGFRNIQSQRFPFNIVVTDNSASGDSNSAVVTTYHNCWFYRISTPYKSDDYIIAQTANVWCEYISSIRGGSSVAETQNLNGGKRRIQPNQVDAIEAAADSRRRLGSLDFAGIMQGSGFDLILP